MEEHLSGTEFESELVKVMIKIVPAHMKACDENKELNYYNYGTENEKSLKLILKYLANIRVVLQDIDLTLCFLSKNRDKILSDYLFLDSHRVYYRYHFENYYIRLLTLLDIIGKLGKLLYDLDIDINKVSAYTFKAKARKEGYLEIANIVEKLVNILSELKNERHEKLHSGEADIEPLNAVVIWEDINSIVGSDTSKLLKQHTDQKINEEIRFLKSNTIDIIEIIKEFLTEATEELKKKITNANK